MKIRDLLVSNQIGFYRPEQPEGSIFFVMRPEDVFHSSNYDCGVFSARDWEIRVLARGMVKRYLLENSLATKFQVQNGDILICRRNKFAGKALMINLNHGDSIRIIPQPQEWYLLRFKDRLTAQQVILYLRGTSTGQNALQRLVGKHSQSKMIKRDEILDLEVPMDHRSILIDILSDIFGSRLFLTNSTQTAPILLLDEEVPNVFLPLNTELMCVNILRDGFAHYAEENPLLWNRIFDLVFGSSAEILKPGRIGASL